MNIILSIISVLIMNMNTLTGETKVSWYGDAHHGRKTANGETFDTNTLTCASPTLPFGTRVEITNPSNGKTVIVRVNDRGPYKVDKNGKALRPLQPHPKRGFDLSKAAFTAIANPNVGTISVVYTILE
jgi:rare lipoprotein A